jgi:hypothetical protein
MTTITVDYATSEVVIDSPSHSVIPGRPARHVSRQRVQHPDETYRVLDEVLNAIDARDVELIAETSYDASENTKVVW